MSVGMCDVYMCGCCEAIAVYASNNTQHATRKSREGRGGKTCKRRQIKSENGYVGIFSSFAFARIPGCGEGLLVQGGAPMADTVKGQVRRYGCSVGKWRDSFKP